MKHISGPSVPHDTHVFQGISVPCNTHMLYNTDMSHACSTWHMFIPGHSIPLDIHVSHLTHMLQDIHMPYDTHVLFLLKVRAFIGTCPCPARSAQRGENNVGRAAR